MVEFGCGENCYTEEMTLLPQQNFISGGNN